MPLTEVKPSWTPSALFAAGPWWSIETIPNDNRTYLFCNLDGTEVNTMWSRRFHYGNQLSQVLRDRYSHWAEINPPNGEKMPPG